MNREEALIFMKEKVQNVNLQKHMLAAEAIMRALAERLGEDVERFGLCGLLHDVDYEATAQDLTRHGLVSYDMLKEKGFDEEFCAAVRAHNENLGFTRDSVMAKALHCCDPLTGLIVAAALIREKNIDNVSVESLKNSFDKKEFAKSINREIIKKCSELGLTLDEFFEISLGAMKGIKVELGL